MHNDPAVAPAALKEVASLPHATWVQRPVEKGPGELLASMQLQGATPAHTQELEAEVGVWRGALVGPAGKAPMTELVPRKLTQRLGA